MGNCAKDRELEKYVDRAYGQLKEGIYTTKRCGGIFKCPFCKEKKNQEYLYDELLQHARSRANSLMRNMDLKQQGQHVALTSYLAKYHGPKRTPSSKGDATPSREKEMHAGFDSSKIIPKPRSEQGQHVALTTNLAKYHGPKETHAVSDSSKISSKPRSEQDAYVERNMSKKFVWPWKGVVVNVPKQLKNGKYVGESGSKLKESLIEQGFDVEKVIPLWSMNGFSGCCVLNFPGDWIGFENAMRFQKSFEDDRHGKMDWQRAGCRGDDKLYGWVATEEDCQSNSLLRRHLETVDLKSVEELVAEGERKTSCLVSHLKNTLEGRDLQEKIIKKEIQETLISVDLEIEKRDAMIEDHNKEMSEVYQSERERVERVLLEHERMKKKIASQKKELKLHEKELDRREVRNENEKKELERQQKMNEIAEEVQKQVRENLLKLAEEQEKEKEALHNQSMELEKELDRKQALVLEVERLRGAVEVMKHMGDTEDAEAKKKMESIAEELEEKEEELEYMEELKQTLIVKEHKASEELQEAMDALINGFLNGPRTRGSGPNITVKNLGELDGKPFENAAKRKYSADVASDKATELWSLWEAYVRDVNWRPFKRISDKETDKEVIDEEDERLQELRNEVGEEAYNEVVNVLKELNEYCPQDRTPRHELWNAKEQRPADLYEGVAFLLNKWKLKKKKT